MLINTRTGLTHSVTTTVANEHDHNQAEHLLHGDKKFVFAENAYRDAEKRENLKAKLVDWHVAESPSAVKSPKKHPRINNAPSSLE